MAGMYDFLRKAAKHVLVCDNAEENIVMEQLRQYFKRHRFILWLALIPVSFVIFGMPQFLLGTPHWMFIIIMILAIPTAILWGLRGKDWH
jgi:hypothetical protein